MQQVIDIHAHIIPPEALRDVNPTETWRPRVFRDEQGRQKVDHAGKVIGTAPREFVDIEGILAEQERAGVDVVCLSPWSSLLNYTLPADEGRRTCRLQNEPLARYASERPDKVAGLGIVPLQDAALAAREVEYIVRDLKLHGIEIGSNVAGSYLGDDKHLPFWEAVADLDAFVFIHPMPLGGIPLFRNFDLGNSFGNPTETGLAATSLIYGGVLERFPSLKICLAHGGGVLPYIIGRLDRGYRARVGEQSPIARPPSSYLRQFYFDTITHFTEALRYLVQLVGADHVLMGSDYPFDMGYDLPRDIVQSLGLGLAETEAILGATARRLLGLEKEDA